MKKKDEAWSLFVGVYTQHGSALGVVPEYTILKDLK